MRELVYKLIMDRRVRATAHKLYLTLFCAALCLGGIGLLSVGYEYYSDRRELEDCRRENPPEDPFAVDCDASFVLGSEGPVYTRLPAAPSYYLFQLGLFWSPFIGLLILRHAIYRWFHWMISDWLSAPGAEQAS